MIVGTEIGERIAGKDKVPEKEPGEKASYGPLRRTVGYAAGIGGALGLAGYFLWGWELMWCLLLLLVNIVLLQGAGPAAMAMFSVVLTRAHWQGQEGREASWITELGPGYAGLLLLVFFDGRALRRRMYQALTVLVVLFALNEISLLDISLEAPKV